MQPFAPTTYFTAENALTQLTAHMANLGQQLENLRAGVHRIDVEVRNSFELAPTGWKSLFDFIDAKAVEFPNDPTWTNLKARKDVLVKDFRDFQARVAASVTAIGPL